MAPTQRTPSPSDQTSCPPGPMRNTKNSSDSRPQPTPPLPSQPSSPPKESQPPRTGDPSEPSTPSRTKLNAVHAGLSLLLPPWNQHNSSKKVETSCLFPNKSSSPATPNATDVKEDGNPTVCNTLPNTDKPSRPHTHTPPEEDKPDLASIRDPHKSTSQGQHRPIPLCLPTFGRYLPRTSLRHRRSRQNCFPRLHHWNPQHRRLRNQHGSRHHRCRIRKQRRTKLLHRQKLLGTKLGRSRLHQDRRR